MNATQMRFDRDTAERLERLYATRDALRRREIVRSALAATRRDHVLDIGCGPGFASPLGDRIRSHMAG